MRWLALACLTVAVLAVAATHGRGTAAAGCGSTIAHFQTQPYERRIARPPAPKLGVQQVGPHAFRFMWTFAQLPHACTPVALVIRVRMDRHATPAFGPNDAIPVREGRGSYLLRVPTFLHPVYGVVAALDRHGVPSSYVWTRITR